MVISIAKGLFHLILRSAAGCTRVAGQREVYFEADLAADCWTGDMAATQHGEGEGHSRIELELTASEALQLVFAQAFFVGNGAIKFRAKSYARVEVV
jgi:hypothetical protein